MRNLAFFSSTTIFSSFADAVASLGKCPWSSPVVPFVTHVPGLYLPGQTGPSWFAHPLHIAVLQTHRGLLNDVHALSLSQRACRGAMSRSLQSYGALATLNEVQLLQQDIDTRLDRMFIDAEVLFLLGGPPFPPPSPDLIPAPQALGQLAEVLMLPGADLTPAETDLLLALQRRYMARQPRPPSSRPLDAA
jgi:hypothetical protein